MDESASVTGLLTIATIALLLIAAAALVGPRLRIAAPLVLVAIGVAASFLTTFGTTDIEPEWILQGVLPPLLYSSAVSMPAMNFRREFGAISGLSVLLVIATSLILGVFFMWAIPQLGFAWGVALGAIVSPTDAVATSIIRQTPVSRRVMAILDGESLLNDASALVLLRAAIVATAATFSFWATAGAFAYSLLVAVAVGGVVGAVNLRIRAGISDPTVNTVISFAVPFLASVPAALLGASGLVAAVVAGLVTGFRGPRELSPRHRMSDSQNWRTVELLLEGAVFLTMGLQIKAIVVNVERFHAGVGETVLIATGALVLTILVRAAYVAPLLGVLALGARRRQALQGRMQELHSRMSTPEGKKDVLAEAGTGFRARTERDIERFARRVAQGVADIEYFIRQPLGWREGSIVVWAGMRGAVTVAAAQTLPADTPERPVLVLVAFAVALMSLLVQGGTIGLLLRWLLPRSDPAAAGQAQAERVRLLELMRASGEAVPIPPAATERSAEAFAAARAYRLAVLAAQRTALLDARDNGTFDAEVLAAALADIDASHIATELHGDLQPA